MQVLTVKTNGFEADVVCFGKGERTLVILPGISITPVAASASAIEAQYAAFSEKYRVVLISRRKDIPEGFTVEDMASDAAAVMKELSLSNADIFGMSQGGMIALCLAAYHPELVRKICLGSSAAKTEPGSRAVFDKWVELSEKRDICALNRAFFGYVYSDELLKKQAETFKALEGVGTDDEMKNFAILAAACLKFDFTEKLKEITCPAFVIAAQKDKVFKSGEAQILANGLGCNMFVYGGYSHAVCDEAPDYISRMFAFFEE